MTFDDLPWFTQQLLTKRYTRCTFRKDLLDGCPLVSLYEGDDADDIDKEAVERYLEKKNSQM